MSKRAAITAIVLLVGGLMIYGVVYFVSVTAPEQARVTEADIARVYATRYATNGAHKPPVNARIRPGQHVRLAIGGLGVGNSRLDAEVGDLTLADLSDAPGLEMVERVSLEHVLAELKLSLSGVIRAGDAMRAGKLIRADWFLLGTSARHSGTNALLVRLVDARSGVMRDFTLVDGNLNPQQMARQLAAFIRKARENASKSIAKRYVAIGGFQDLSPNEHAASFGKKLRSYLLDTLRNSNITLLERETVDLLHQEMELDLAGFTEGNSREAGAMESAIWFVDGVYHSLEAPAYDVECEIKVNRFFGRSMRKVFVGKPAEALEDSVKEFVAGAVDSMEPVPYPTRASEARSQFNEAMDLLDADITSHRVQFSGYLITFRNWQTQDYKSELLQKNLEEAKRALKCSLLLDPNDPKAKLYLAICLELMPQRSIEEIGSYYHDAIDGAKNPLLRQLAKDCLEGFIGSLPHEEKVRWCREAAASTGNKEDKVFYLGLLQSKPNSTVRLPAKEIGIPDESKISLLRSNLMEQARETLLAQESKNRKGHYYYEYGISQFMDGFGTNSALAEKKLEEMLPKLALSMPQIAPHLTLLCLKHEVTTNNALVEEFSKSMKEFLEHPNEDIKYDYWDDARETAAGWCMNHCMFSLAHEIMTNRKEAAARRQSLRYSDGDTFLDAYALAEGQRWQDAIDLLETLSGDGVYMDEGGPWGLPYQPVVPSSLLNYCRKQLGLPPKYETNEFQIGTQSVRINTGFCFDADDDGLWVAKEAHLVHLDFNMQPTFSAYLPGVTTCVVNDDRHVWISTGESGLIQLDKQSHAIKVMSTEDGLMYNCITCLARAADDLWIGYGRISYADFSESIGGVSRLDIPRNKLQSFVPSLNGNRFDTNRAPDRSVQKFEVSNSGEVWALERGASLKRFLPTNGRWEAPLDLRDKPTAAAFSDDEMFVSFEDIWHHWKVGTRNLRTGSWTWIDKYPGLPNGDVSSLKVNGNSLWIGGLCYVAEVDLNSKRVKRFARLAAGSIGSIRIAQGYAWIGAPGGIYRVPLHK